MKIAKILKNIPMSGSKPEFHFGNDFKRNLWIEFFRSDESSWYGCFSADHYSKTNKIATDYKNFQTAVLAGGKIYLIDNNTNALLFSGRDEDILVQDIIISIEKELLFYCTWYAIYIVKDKVIIKDLFQKEVDGIRFSKVDDFFLYGEYQPILQEEKWIPFKIDLDLLDFQDYI